MVDSNNKKMDTAGLDLTRLNPWLLEQVVGISGTPGVTQYSGGASNWTYCLTYPEKEVVRAHDMGREYRLQAALKPVYSYVPEMLAHSDDESLVGAEFYVMEKFNGLIPRTNMPRGLNLTTKGQNLECAWRKRSDQMVG